MNFLLAVYALAGLVILGFWLFAAQQIRQFGAVSPTLRAVIWGFGIAVAGLVVAGGVALALNL